MVLHAVAHFQNSNRITTIYGDKSKMILHCQWIVSKIYRPNDNFPSFCCPHMPRTASFTLEKWAIWADCIFEIYRFRWRFWRKDRNRIYCRFWFTVFGIKGTAPSSENSKSFINQNVLVRPGLRKKMLKKLSFSQNWEILIY